MLWSLTNESSTRKVIYIKIELTGIKGCQFYISKCAIRAMISLIQTNSTIVRVVFFSETPCINAEIFRCRITDILATTPQKQL